MLIFFISEKSIGFRIQRDSETSYHALEVVKDNRLWKLYIEPIPKKWVYMSFTWGSSEGLKLYLDGDLTFKTEKSIYLDDLERDGMNDEDYYGMKLGWVTGSRFYGQFKIAHLALWDKSLNAVDMKRAYAANVDTNVVKIAADCWKQKRMYHNASFLFGVHVFYKKMV